MVNRQPKITEAQASQLSDELKAQFELERWWIDDCTSRAKRYSDMLRESGRVTSDKGVQRLLLSMAEQLGAHIEYTIETPKRGGHSRNTLFLQKMVQYIEPFELAYLILGEATNSVMTSDKGFMTVPAMATLLAEALNQEFKYRAMLKIAPEMPKIVKRVLKESRASIVHRKRTFVTLFHKKTGKHVPPLYDDNTTRILAGNALVEMLFTTPALSVVNVEKAYDVKKRDVRWVLKPSQGLKDLFNKDLDVEFLARKTIPLGILTYAPGRRSFASEMLITNDPPPIKMNRLKGKLEAIGETVAKKDLGMRALLDTLTFLEQTPLKINQQMLDFVYTHKAILKSVGALDSAYLDLPACPVPEGKKKEQMTEQELKKFLEWKKLTEKQHNRFWKDRCKVVRQERQLLLAQKLSQYERFYQRWYSDFRGRVYPVNPILTFQANPLAKSLLEFAEPVTLKVGDPQDAAWCELIEYGVRLHPDYSKVSIEQIAPLFADRKAIESVVTKAIESFTNAASPDAMDVRSIYQKNFLPFMAWALHVESLVQRWGCWKETGHPIRRDATCSSMQHMAALAGDTKVLAATNCAPDASTVRDLYRDVAPNPEELGLKRDDIKQFVMTYAYNSTDYGRKKTIKERFEESFGGKFEYRRVIEANDELKKVVHSGLGKVIKLQTLLMDVFKGLVVTRKIHALSLTPTEFVVDSEKWEFPTKQYRIHHFDATIQVRYKDIDCDSPDINLRETRQCWVANIIHSLDAALLHLSLGCLSYIAEREGPRVHVHTIHDCVVSRPGDMSLVMQALESAFQQMYSANPQSGVAEALHRMLEFWELEEYAPDIYKKFIKLKAAPEEMYQNMKYFFV